MGRGLAALLLAALASCLPCSTGQQPSSPGQPRLAGSEPVQPNSPESPAGPSNVWGVLMWGQAWLQHSYLLNGEPRGQIGRRRGAGRPRCRRPRRCRHH